jgi:hypothetical protein
MKTIAVLTGLLMVVFMIRHTAMSSPAINNHSEIHSNSDSGEFKMAIQPILQNNCSPCHFPGGKMYASMPFDKAETIIHHEAGVKKRLQKEKEGNPVIAFLNKNKMR